MESLYADDTIAGKVRADDVICDHGAADNFGGCHGCRRDRLGDQRGQCGGDGATSGLLAPAADEVSAAITNLFGVYSREYHAVVQQAAAFHHEFTQALAGAANAYATAEGAGTAGLGGTPQTPSPQFTPISAELSLFVGPTGVPIPSPKYVTNANNLYVRSMNALQALFTPEELYPITGVKSMTLNSSVTEGLNILNSAITQQLQSPSNTLTVFGYSQSAIIASLEMQKLAALGPLAPGANQLNFVLVGNEMNPNGGLLARFPNLSIASLGLTFYGGTPADTIYPTNIYTLEYDGFADFPQYPLNFRPTSTPLRHLVRTHHICKPVLGYAGCHADAGGQRYSLVDDSGLLHQWWRHPLLHDSHPESAAVGSTAVHTRHRQPNRGPAPTRLEGAR